MKHDPVVGEIIAGAIKVHRALGPGLLENAYERCLDYELEKRGLRIERQVPVPLIYEGVRLDCGYRLDLVIDGDVIVELKCVDALAPIHTAQVLTYLRLADARHALLMNFNCPTLREGLRSFVGCRRQPPGPRGYTALHAYKVNHDVTARRRSVHKSAGPSIPLAASTC